MGGGLMQLVAYGAQDIYLTGNPQITFFKVVYRRHTNFAMETIAQTLQGTAANGASVSAIISRNGDLVHRLCVTSATASITNGSAIVASAELEIGGQKIDKQTAEWMNIWTELSTPESKCLGLKSMQGDIGLSGKVGVNDESGPGMIQVPLQFWFCRNPGLALPLIALQYHEVKVKMVLGSVTGTAGVKLWADYIYLDTDERRRFAQVSHEYLIEQVQEASVANSKTIKLNFNHPVKELIWTSPVTNAYLTAQLKLNGHDRFAAQEEEYFQLRQPYDHHTAIPSQNLPPGSATEKLNTVTNLLAKTVTGLNGLTTGEEEIEDGEQLTTGICAVSATSANEITDSLFDGAPARAVTATAARNPGTAGAAGNPVYSFLKADITTPVVGERVTIVYSINSGTDKLVKQCTAEASNVGAAGGGNYSSACTHVIFSIRLEAFNNLVDQSPLVIFAIYRGDTNGTVCRTSQMTKKINVYSFALKPEEHQPSGTCNFSRIDNAQLVFGAAPGAATGKIYAVNYNVLRIMSGMGGLAYSN